MKAATGGFELPKIYSNNKQKLLKYLNQGKQDLVELSHWSTADDFLHYILEQQFLEFADQTYPTPRKKTEVPVWFLISAQLLLKLHTETSYHELETLLKSGSILSQVGFNIGKPLGFNDKNTYQREVACNQDTVRKFFKDSKVEKMRDWFGKDLQKWFLKNNAIDLTGIFILDQSRVVVPDNSNYSDAVMLPVDENGHFYKEQKEGQKYHPCYTLSTLLNINRAKNLFHYAGYELGPGNEDELLHAESIIPRYVQACGKQVIKLLIVDRGYISAEFINYCKIKCNFDLLHPLRKDMSLYIDAINISKLEGQIWEIVSDPEEENKRERAESFKITSAVMLKLPKLWENCQVELYTTVVKTEEGANYEVTDTHHFVLCSTKMFHSAREVYEHYKLRSRVEECFRQIKTVWQLNKFSSPNRSLMEAHVGFILLTYSLLNAYLRERKQHSLVGQFLTTLRKEAKANSADKQIVAYADDVYGLFSVKEYMQAVCQLDDKQREKLMEGLDAIK